MREIEMGSGIVVRCSIVSHSHHIQSIRTEISHEHRYDRTQEESETMGMARTYI